jgi:hypothetical protein
MKLASRHGVSQSSVSPFPPSEVDLHTKRSLNSSNIDTRSPVTSFKDIRTLDLDTVIHAPSGMKTDHHKIFSSHIAHRTQQPTISLSTPTA